MKNSKSSFRKRAAIIWREQTDREVSPEMEGPLTAAAWKAWARAGDRWPSVLARAASRAMEEARLFGGDPLRLLVTRPMRMMKPRPRGRVALYRRQEWLHPEQLAGYGFQPSATAADARGNTGTTS